MLYLGHTFYYGLHIFIYLYMHANRHATKWDNGLYSAIIAKHVWITVVGTPNHQVFQKDNSHPTGSGELEMEQYAHTALTGSCESRPLKRLNTSAGSPSWIFTLKWSNGAEDLWGVRKQIPSPNLPQESIHFISTPPKPCPGTNRL